MISAKQKLVIRTDLYRCGRGFVIAAIWLAAIQAFFAIVNLIFGGIGFVDLLDDLRGIFSGWTFIASVTPFVYFLITPYSNFKWTIQNGISRKTMWRSQMLSAVIITLVQEVLIVLFEVLADGHPAEAFIVNSSVSTWQGILFELLLLFEATMTAMAIGYFFSLLNRKWKVIVAIGGPILAAFCIYYLTLLLIKLGVFQFIGSNWSIDLSGQAAKTAIIVTLVVSAIVWTLLMMLVSRISAKHMQLRRD
ncbi:hypothetical protein [uncultured Limosilactobacillus sp.]|uniref:hypothetical protein n=1 Tax=uncultured Limosilactobacillus sp. TaxID=2837629 RepID=UPI0025925A65|nr:hypothetical protein [uncultured Limosilactobacillus sp.]